MLERVSALAGHTQTGRFGDLGPGGPGVTLSEIRDAGPVQIAAWPDTLPAVGAMLAELAGAGAAPGPGRSAAGPNGTLLRMQPLAFWLTGADAAIVATAMAIETETGSALDLTHSRAVIRIEGRRAAELLNRGLSLDLSPAAFPTGTCATGAIHHVGVQLHRRDNGTKTSFDLYIPRSFAVSIWAFLTETAAQWGYQVKG